MSTVTLAAEKRGRLMFIIEAALEYFIALLVSGSFLATLTKELGFSDSLTGILSSIISLGCLFQLFSIIIRPKRNKGFVIALSILNQILFISLYVIPLLEIKASTKTLLFVVAIIGAYFVYNVAHPKKINWFMSLVDDFKRGEFTAVKEIISLITGMAFTFGMGAVTDRFKDKGEIKTAFIISVTVIAVITVLHTLSMIFTPEKETVRADNKNILKNMAETLKNKEVMLITGVFVLYYIAKDFCVPFYGAYAINEMGFSLTEVTFFTVLTCLSRIIASLFIGKYADKKSFTQMILICFVFLALAFLCMTFTKGRGGRVMFLLYYIVHGISQAGINNAFINMIYDYVPKEKRADSLAVCQALSGLFGFLTTLLSGALVAYIQNSGNKLFGISVYAAQVTSFLGFVFALLTIIYVKRVVMRLGNRSSTCSAQ